MWDTVNIPKHPAIFAMPSLPFLVSTLYSDPAHMEHDGTPELSVMTQTADSKDI